MTYLRYAPEIERPAPDEQETIDGIIQGMTQQSQTVEKREHHAVRASHTKSSACVTGELTVAPGLPPELAQGLFATPGTYPVAVRLAQGPGETLGDGVSTHRGMSIKVFGVSGDKLLGHDVDTQDFVLATGTTFPLGTAAGFLRDGTVIGKPTGLPEGLKSAVSSTARNINKVLHAFGTESAMADFFGHPYSHPLADSYFSQAPVRFGDYVAKLGAVPATDAQRSLSEWRLDPRQDEDGFRHAALAFFRENDVVFELKAQLWADAEKQPIEDASVDWPILVSPYRTVATVRLPRQDAYSPERVRYFDEVMTFRPAHSLAAHRPLGSVMRARLQVYRALSDFLPSGERRDRREHCLAREHPGLSRPIPKPHREEEPMTLQGKTFAILIAPRGTEEPEFTKPRDALLAAGAAVTVVGLEAGEAETVNNDLDPAGKYPVDKAIDAVSASSFDGLVIPGGSVGADKLRGSKAVVGFVRDFFQQGKPVGVICHGPWTLVEADVVKGRKLTSFPTVKTDIRNAGGEWVDAEVVVDKGLVTSRNPKDLPAFCAKIVEEFAEGHHPDQARSA